MADWQVFSDKTSAWGQLAGKFLSAMLRSHDLIGKVNLILVVLMSYYLAAMTWRLLPGVEQPPLPQLSRVSLEAPRPQEFDIGRWHLFGERQVEQVSPSAVKVIPETRLNLILRGVVAGEGGSASGAIIASPSGDQSFYALGAKLPGGAVLKEVHEHHIVLLRSGQLETLQLPRDNLDVADEIMGRSDSRDALAPPALMGLSEYRDTLMQNPQQLADLVQARPYHRNGISGYQINPGRDPALFSRLGLQANDVITMVNGVRLDNPARGLSILQSLRERTQVTVEVVRNGTPQTLSIDLNQ